MNLYSVARALYHGADRWVFRRLPVRWDQRMRRALFPLAKRWFPQQVLVKSPGEFAASAPTPRPTAVLPAWAYSEVKAQLPLEPGLAPLLAGDGPLEAYFIPWDSTYVGTRWAYARRQLSGPYRRMILAGSGCQLPPLAEGAGVALVDVDVDPELKSWAARMGTDYVAVPAEHLDSNDQCALLARLVLQLAPEQLVCLPHPIVQRCLARHRLALGSVCRAIVEPATGGAQPLASEAASPPL